MSIGTSLCARVVFRSRCTMRLDYARAVAAPIIQIFGKKKDSETRKAERWFKERGLKVQSVELTEKGLSPGELKSVAARVGGVEALIDRDGKRYVEKGLKYSAPTGPRIEALLIEDPLLLKTPIVRRGMDATLGFAPDVWETWK
jgi:arsenate reductase-like glutaredoxin family protein